MNRDHAFAFDIPQRFFNSCPASWAIMNIDGMVKHIHYQVIPRGNINNFMHNIKISHITGAVTHFVSRDWLLKEIYLCIPPSVVIVEIERMARAKDEA